MPMMSQVMSHGGITPQQAATMLNIVAPAAPGEEITSAEGALRALEEMRVKGTGEKFGVTNKMSKYEAFKAFGRNIAEREKALKAEGKTDEEIEVEIAQQLREANVAAEIRERRGLVRGIARQGVQLGGFQRFEAVGQATPTDFDRQLVKDFAASDQGRQNRVNVAKAAEEARMGARNDPLLRRRQIAEVELTAAGRFEELPWLDRAKGMLPFSDDRRTQQINRQMLSRARAELGEQMGYGDMVASQTRAGTDTVMRELLKRIEQNTRKEGGAGQAPPLSAPPPRPAARLAG
jgi:hypothetical protein